MPPLVQTRKSPLHRLNFVTFTRGQMNFPKNMLARYEKKKKKDGMKRNESVKREKTRLEFTWRGEIRMEGE